MRAIHDRLAAPLAPTDLADALFVSLRTLERHLTEALGCTPSELILAVKMREARRLIARPELQVQEIARSVGYDDPAHFSRRFKAYFGLAPAAWRQAAERPAGVRRPAA
jgi:AraC-like DNA-binding protein